MSDEPPLFPSNRPWERRRLVKRVAPKPMIMSWSERIRRGSRIILFCGAMIALGGSFPLIYTSSVARFPFGQNYINLNFLAVVLPIIVLVCVTIHWALSALLRLPPRDED